MKHTRLVGALFLICTVAIAGLGAQAPATPAAPPAGAPPAQTFEPVVGQAGKDVVWVPTSPALVEKMLDMAGVTAQDFVMDLGSGDGRNISAAAKRGARATGVEFNPDMVALSRRMAREAGVEERATFVQGDMYEADISQATVLALFLLPGNLDKLAPKFMALRPGTRIVLNTFEITGWEANATETLTEDCSNWCTALLHIVPARAEGRWRFEGGELTLKQEFQMVSGTFALNGRTGSVEGRLRGTVLLFSVGGTNYAGEVNGNQISGTARATDGTTRNWTATRIGQ
jgi:precorrin-6B methylase 2